MNKAAIILVLLATTAEAKNPEYRKDYLGFTVWMDCKEHAAYKFRYNAGHDMGDYDRTDDFRLDSQVPYECQPSSTATFSTKNIPGAPLYHRGHLVAANHVDYSEQAIKESFYMTNILPMTQAVNLGAWAETEKITECYRDKTELLVLGGATWGKTKKDKQKTTSLGATTSAPRNSSGRSSSRATGKPSHGTSRTRQTPSAPSWTAT